MVPASAIRSTREQITDLLRQEVFSGRLTVGERVSELSLAERFGVSRGPIREALTQMVSEGLFVSRPNCGVMVAAPAPPEIRQLILPIRLTLETYALRQIFPLLGPDDFRRWDEILFRMERVCQREERDQWPQLDIELHRTWMERLGQPDLLAIWQTVITRMRAHFWTKTEEVCRQGDMRLLLKNHQRLIDAFRGNDLEQAVLTLQDHINDN
jgi:DNA-binding GntR family transcriptional regulator